MSRIEEHVLRRAEPHHKGSGHKDAGLVTVFSCWRAGSRWQAVKGGT